MILACLQHKSESLNAQIMDAERQVSNRRQTVEIRTARLINDIHDQMTAPASLVLAGGIGFIVGELSKCRAPKLICNTADNPQVEADTTPLRAALSLAMTAHALYKALPISWLVNRFQQSTAAKPTTAQETDHGVTSSSN